MRPFLIILFCCFFIGTAHAQEDLSPYEIALQRIEEARERDTLGVDLSGLGLTEIPPQVWEIENLYTLWLQDNALTSLPPEIGNLVNLGELNLANNQLSSLPPEIGNLRIVYWLDLSGNQLSNLPSEIGSLSSLGNLILNENQLSSLPAEIGNLSRLASLELNGNQLTSLPPEIGNLVNLQDVWLSYNLLSTLPAEIGSLSNLCFLGLAENQLKALPASLGELHILEEAPCFEEHLDFGRNSMPLDSNPLSSIPDDVLDGGTAAILAYLRNEAWWHIQRLVLGALLPVGIIAGFLLAFRLRGEKAKRKRGNT